MFSKKRTTKMGLDEINEKLNSLRIPLSLVTTPINFNEEKAKFMDSDTYCPNFRYRVVKNNNEKVFQELLRIEEVENVDERISQFYINLIMNKKLAHDLMCSVGKNDIFTELSIRKFKFPSSILFRNSCRVMRGDYKNYGVIDTNSLKKEKHLYYNDVREIFLNIFDEFGLKEWNVNKSINIRKDGVKTGIKSKEIFIDPNIKKTLLEIKKTVVHELTHVLRAHNGQMSGVEALSKPNLNTYLDVEEGLAMWNEENMGYLKDIDLKERAAMVYAIYLGKTKSFRDLYNIMFGLFPKNKAFHLTYFAKRGLGDTSLPGIFTRSASYFRGFRKVKKKLAADASLYNKLYAGKIGFKQVKWVDEGLIKEAKIVPSQDIFEKVFKNFQ